MSWLDKLLGRGEKVRKPNDDITPEEHERHLEQSANPGSASVVPPDAAQTSADELEQSREEPTGEEKLEETRHRDDQEGRFTREPPRSH
jgi:hypothetical protein